GALNCHTRTIYRDLEALQVAGFPIYTDRAGGRNLWFLLETARHNIPIPFSLPELMALYFSRGMMMVLKDTAFFDSLESLFDKIKSTLPPEYIDYLEQIENSLEVRAKPYKHYARLRETVEKVSQAAIEKKLMEIVYYTMSRKSQTRRKIAPYKIWYFDGTFYLIANCGLREDIRIFALDRIKKLAITNESFETPEDFNIDEFMKPSFGVFHGKPIQVRIWFASDIAEYIREKIWHNSQRIESQNDGSIIFELEVAGTEEIKSWVLKWGAKARVLAPDALREEIRQEIAAMLANYRHSAAR
ncbi:MAG: WYL domain-containing transcriptional regulator, partial [Desulfobacterales bacterium]